MSSTYDIYDGTDEVNLFPDSSQRNVLIFSADQLLRRGPSPMDLQCRSLPLRRCNAGKLHEQQSDLG